MEVDPPTSQQAAASATSDSGGAASSSQSQQEKTLKVHPLAIIGISDHHTRVTRGGSILARDAPVLGLLFGFQDGLEVSIVDSEEVEYSFSASAKPAGGRGGAGGFGGGTEAERAQHRQSIKTKIELHRSVFPTHEVIGWYRVGAELTAEDLHVNNGPMREYNESPVFVLMNPDPSDDSKELPISIFETLVTVGGGAAGGAAGGGASGEASSSPPAGQQQQPRAVFVGLDFELNTCEPERIAVEKVFKAQATDGASGLDVQLQSLTSSIQSMNARVAVLLDFLKKTQSGEIPPDHKLLRQVDGLLRQLPVFASADLPAEFNNEYDDALLITYLGSIAKTARVVQGYSEKFRIAHESNTGGGREMRRGY